MPGEYVVGWAKRGPSGVIGTNKCDALETVSVMLDDIPTLQLAPSPRPSDIDRLLNERSVRYVTVDEWRRLEEIEIAEGVRQGRPRVKFAEVDDMLAVLERG